MPTKWLVRMNRITHVWMTTLLLTLANVAVANTNNQLPPIAPQHTKVLWAKVQEIVAPKGTAAIATYRCRSRGTATGEILLQADARYIVNHRVGRYIPTQLGYRFSDGVLGGRSIVRHQQSIYLVDTKNEDRAARLAAVDRALICEGGEIKY